MFIFLPSSDVLVYLGGDVKACLSTCMGKNDMLTTVCLQPCWKPPVHMASSIKVRFGFDVEELKWPEQNMDLNPSEPLLDKLGKQL